MIGNDKKESFKIYGLAERCKNKVSIDPSIETEPYRLWTADHFSKDFPNSSMYGVAPII